MLDGHLSRRRCHDALLDLDSLRLDRWPLTLALLERAFELADRISSCDGLYVALAGAVGVPLVTRDARLARGADALVAVELV